MTDEGGEASISFMLERNAAAGERTIGDSDELVVPSEGCLLRACFGFVSINGLWRITDEDGVIAV